MHVIFIMKWSRYVKIVRQKDQYNFFYRSTEDVIWATEFLKQIQFKKYTHYIPGSSMTDSVKQPNFIMQFVDGV